jgi:hypothetical protein
MHNGAWQAGSMATSTRYATLVTDGAPGNLTIRSKRFRS